MRLPGSAGSRQWPLRLALVFFALAAALVAPTASADAARWRQLPASRLDSLNEAWLLRLHDGGLEAAYRSPGSAPDTQTLATAKIGSSGEVAGGPHITGDWISLNNPAVIPDEGGLTAVPCVPNTPGCPDGYQLVPESGGLRAFWGGIENTSVPEPSLETATAPSAAGPWTYQFGGVNVAQCTEGTVCPPPGDLAKLFSYAADASAVELGDGTPLEAWASTLGVFVHPGTRPGDARNDDVEVDGGEDDDIPEHSGDFQAPLGGCCGYAAQLALDGASGKPFVAWYSNAAGPKPAGPGIYIQEVDPATGDPLGTSFRVPRSTSESGFRFFRTPLTGRPKRSDLYTAMPVGPGSRKLIEQRFLGPDKKQPSAILISRGVSPIRNVNVTADAAGRVWVVWTRQVPGSTRVNVFARRSNFDTTHFGARVEVAPPPHTTDSFAIDASARGNTLDVVGTFGQSGVAKPAIWHTQLHPGVTAHAGKIVAAPGKKATATVSVSDARAPIRGAKVTLLGTGRAHAYAKRHRRPTTTTSRTGKAHLRIGPFRHSTHVRFRVSKRAYATTTIGARVKVLR